MSSPPATFCHTYDLGKRLEPSSVKGKLHAIPVTSSAGLGLGPLDVQSPFKLFIADVTRELNSSPSSAVHRIVIPNILSPTLYTPKACRPSEVLRFLHALRALLRHFPEKLTAMLTLPTSLHPRATGLTRWMEILSDGVLELIPLQYQNNLAASPKTREGAQGLVKLHSLPVETERGRGSETGNPREDLSFKLSASNGLVIKPFSLPPVDADADTKSTSTTSESGVSKLEF